MDIFYYIMMFIIGTVFGSFSTLAVYRIPLKKDITHERSFCPKCNHKLGFWDMIPVLSYIFSKGKCRYCGEKIRIRYLILEVLSGLVFMLGYIALNMKFPDFEINKIIYYISFVFFCVTCILIAGIDKENRNIHKGIILFGLIMQVIYILYLYVMQKVSIYRYGMYLIIMIFLLILDTISIKKKCESKYIVQILLFFSYIGFCIGSELLLLTTLLTIIFIALYNIYRRIKISFYDEPNILQNNILPKTRIGFFLAISAIIITIAETFITYI